MVRIKHHDTAGFTGSHFTSILSKANFGWGDYYGGALPVDFDAYFPTPQLFGGPPRCVVHGAGVVVFLFISRGTEESYGAVFEVLVSIIPVQLLASFERKR